MVPIKKKVNEENNCDVVEFDYGHPSIWFKLDMFNWICKQTALDGISMAMQYLSDNVFSTDSNGSVWFLYEKCMPFIRQHCLQFYSDPHLLKKFGLIVNCCT